MKKILDAIKFSEEKHFGQTRKSGDPYITHPIAVSYIVASVKASSKHIDELLVASICHDNLEDTDTTFIELAERFGPLVASLVKELTNDEQEIARIGKIEYHKKKLVGISSYGLVIKLADRLHNVSDNPSQKMIVETKELIEHLSKKRKLSRSHKKLASEILEICNNRLNEKKE